MSKLHFINDPFPDNHNGFDYTPKSFMDVQHEVDAEGKAVEDSAAQNKMMSMIASIFK